MRIVAGTFGGRKIRTTEDSGLRPAMAKTRESLFSMLEARGIVWEGINVLDLFCGCGSLALECMSRGARTATLVDKGRPALECAKRNIEDFSLLSRCRIVPLDVQRFLKGDPQIAFDLVFIDPPYRCNLAKPALSALCKRNWLKNGAFIVAEIEKDASITAPEALEPVTQRLFGQTCLHIWKNK